MNPVTENYYTVIHTMAYFRGKFALGLKGRFYAKLFFVSKGKILRHHCLYVLNGKILRQTSYVKPNACAYIFKFIHKGKILRHGLFYCMIMASKPVSMATQSWCSYKKSNTYHIVGYFQGGKFLRISRIKNNS